MLNEIEKLIKKSVENYHNQLEIVGGISKFSLFKYLKDIEYDNESIMFALEYNEKREQTDTEKEQNENLHLLAKKMKLI